MTAPPPSVANLHASLALHGATAIAFRNANGTLTNKTYADLLSDARRAEQYLQQLGLGSGARVGILADNCYEWLVLDVACIALGCMLVALTPEVVTAGTRNAVARYALAVLFTDHSSECGPDAAAIDLHSLLQATPRPSRAQLPSTAAPDDHFAISFSSGSTGLPKGMIVSRTGVDFLAGRIIGDFELTPQDGIYIFLPLSNFQQRLLFYTAVLAGTAVYFTTTAWVLKDMEHFKPSFFVAPPVLYSNILRLFDLQQDGGRSLREMLGGNFRFSMVGMAPTDTRMVERFHEEGLPVLESYGLSEVGTIAWNTVAHCRIGTVGRPVDRSEIAFSDEQEILICRKHPLCLGYLAEAGDCDSGQTFRTDGLIATGDIGYLDDAGFLVLSGRRKNIVVTTSGHKYQPEHVERELSALKHVNFAVVYHCQKHEANFAIINVSRKSPDTIAQLQKHVDLLNASLPAYQKIARLLVNDDTYTTDNGLLTTNLKLNRNRIVQKYSV